MSTAIFLTLFFISLLIGFLFLLKSIVTYCDSKHPEYIKKEEDLNSEGSFVICSGVQVAGFHFNSSTKAKWRVEIPKGSDFNMYYSELSFYSRIIMRLLNWRVEKIEQ